MPSSRQLEKRIAQVVLLLILCGSVGMVARHRARHDVRFREGDTAWRVSYSVECQADRNGAVLRMATPADTAYCRVIRQDVQQDNLQMGPVGRLSSETREIVALAENEGPCQARVRFDLRLSNRETWAVADATGALSARQRAAYLRATPTVQTQAPVVSETLRELRDAEVDQESLVRRIFVYCREEIVVGDEDPADDAATTLEDGGGSALGCAHAMIALCRAATIPARPVAGFILESGERTSANVWVEVFLKDRWIPYDPVYGYERELPPQFVPARKGDDRVMITQGGRDLEVEYEIAPLPRAALGASATGQHLSDILDLTRLPLELQRVLALILLMPLGALVTSVFRNVIGLHTSGTFAPTLLALSFVFADWKTGLLILVATLAVGLVARYLVDALHLLLVPRLCIILTLVVLGVVYGISALDYLRVAPGTAAVLFPMVILTMLVERFFLTTQEDGWAAAMQHLGGTTVVAVSCYLILRWEAVAHVVLAYPEVHCFSVAALILLGRYTGYRLLEPWRFRDAALLVQTR
jgi:transglutaminase-like putative cysteine protease